MWDHEINAIRYLIPLNFIFTLTTLVLQVLIGFHNSFFCLFCWGRMVWCCWFMCVCFVFLNSVLVFVLNNLYLKFTLWSFGGFCSMLNLYIKYTTGWQNNTCIQKISSQCISEVRHFSSPRRRKQETLTIFFTTLYLLHVKSISDWTLVNVTFQFSQGTSGKYVVKAYWKLA